MKILFLCHIWFGTYTQLYVTEDNTLCHIDQAQHVWIERYNMKDKWEADRLGAICGWSNERCPHKGK